MKIPSEEIQEMFKEYVKQPKVEEARAGFLEGGLSPYVTGALLGIMFNLELNGTRIDALEDAADKKEAERVLAKSTPTSGDMYKRYKAATDGVAWDLYQCEGCGSFLRADAGTVDLEQCLCGKGTWVLQCKVGVHA